MECDRFDVLVMGGGPAGCAAAIELAGAGLSVGIIERARIGSREHAGETLPPGIAPLLTRLGVWKQFAAQGHRPCFGMQTAWGSGGSNTSSYMVSPYGHGWHVNRQRLDCLLAERAEALGATVRRRSRVRQLESQGAMQWDAVIENGLGWRSVSSRYLIDASGRTSPLRNRLGARNHVHDHLVGIGAWFDIIRSAPSDIDCALIEATEEGWWYSAPTSQQARRIAVFMTDLDLLRRGRGSVRAYWQQRLNETERLQDLLHGATQVAPFRTYLASSHQVLQLGQSGWLPAGDALQSVDPLSGRGVSSAMQSGIAAAEAVVRLLDGQADATADYLSSSRRSFGQYLVERLEFYGMEKRWCRSTFWRRRTVGFVPE
uniref:Flavoprotein dehydrogenase n=1 Tax=uncultured bacterium 'pool 3 contig00022' TaxID=1497872 RepID=A0A059V8C1_9BACT|nr:flavoprotein dehydrogenase [uncultured bacterium 'pool 3 contig00022']